MRRGIGSLWRQGWLWGRVGKFTIVGATGIGVNMFLLYVFHDSARLPLLLASPLAIEGSIASNFVWNDVWTFGRRSRSIRRFAKFNLVSIGSLVIQTGALYGIVAVLHLYYLAANLIAIGIGFLWNVCVNFLWTWKEGA